MFPEVDENENWSLTDQDNVVNSPAKENQDNDDNIPDDGDSTDIDKYVSQTSLQGMLALGSIQE